MDKDSINESLIIFPYMLNFITTNKCTAACTNCCFQCSPKRREKLSLEDMKNYIDQSIIAYPSIKVLVFTGGECFTLKKDLDKIIKYGSEKSLITRVVTNAYWAKSFKSAYLRLKELVKMGLNEVNISTGDEHQEWVPYEYVVNAIVASLKLNLPVVVNIESAPSSSFKSEKMKTDARIKKYLDDTQKRLIIMNGIWIPINEPSEKENKEIDAIDNKIFCTNGRCRTLFEAVSIDPYHRMSACCGLTSENNTFLQLGSTKKHLIKELYEYQFSDFIKIWLYTEGPLKILNFINHQKGVPPIDFTSKHLCQICNEIFQDRENILILRENYKSVFSNVMLKYILLRTPNRQQDR